MPSSHHCILWVCSEYGTYLSAQSQNLPLGCEECKLHGGWVASLQGLSHLKLPDRFINVAWVNITVWQLHVACMFACNAIRICLVFETSLPLIWSKTVDNPWQLPLAFWILTHLLYTGYRTLGVSVRMWMLDISCQSQIPRDVIVSRATDRMEAQIWIQTMNSGDFNSKETTYMVEVTIPGLSIRQENTMSSVSCIPIELTNKSSYECSSWYFVYSITFAFALPLG